MNVLVQEKITPFWQLRDYFILDLVKKKLSLSR